MKVEKKKSSKTEETVSTKKPSQFLLKSNSFNKRNKSEGICTVYVGRCSLASYKFSEFYLKLLHNSASSYTNI